MPPGIGGHLLSSAFIEQEVPALLDSADDGHVRNELAGWWRRCATLGPSSTPRTILQSAAPLFAALGFEAAAQIESAESAIAGTLRSGTHAVALVVTPWGDACDPLWRLGVTQAVRRSAAWCLIFNGLNLRIVDASRLYARRCVSARRRDGGSARPN